MNLYFKKIMCTNNKIQNYDIHVTSYIIQIQNILQKLLRLYRETKKLYFVRKTLGIKFVIIQELNL
jgi:hypothetical protein